MCWESGKVMLEAISYGEVWSETSFPSNLIPEFSKCISSVDGLGKISRFPKVNDGLLPISALVLGEGGTYWERKVSPENV